MSAPRDERRPLPPGWSEPSPAHLPEPSAWPALTAFGVALGAWGLVASPVLVLLGFAVFFAALGLWIGEIAHDHDSE